MRPWREETIYHIFIDRFSGRRESNPLAVPAQWCGGTINGIVQRLDHIQSLGATSILLTPFFTGTAYHGYHTTDFYSVDERFGSLEDLRQFSAELHRRNMRFCIDYVPNHCSNQHPYFVDALNDPRSEYREWFWFDKWPEKYKTFLGFSELPKLNLTNPVVRTYFIDNATWWLRQIDFDAMRIDHAVGPPMGFWPEFISALKASKPSLAVFGEIWLYNCPSKYRDRVTVSGVDLLLAKLVPNRMHDKYFRTYLQHFDGVLDFTCNRLLRQYAAGKLGLGALHKQLDAHYCRMPADALLFAFLDNHDMDRIMFVAGNDRTKVQEVLDLMAQLPQPKLVYYGTEFAMSQAASMHDLSSHGDIQVRGIPPWETEANLLTLPKAH